MVASKAKGNAAERKAADQLSAWWGETFKRIPTSGALRWGGVTDTYGDLLCPVSFPFVVECKHRANFDLLSCLTKAPQEKNLLGWWQQAIDDAIRCKTELGQARQPLLMAKGNRTTPVLCVSEELGLALGPVCPGFKLINPMVPTLYIYPQGIFLKSVSRGTIENALKDLKHSILEAADGRSIRESS